MSTHIEHGSRIRVKTIAELNALMLTFRQQIEAVARDLYYRQTAALVYQILDEALLQPTEDAFHQAVRHEYATQPIDDPQPFLETDLRWIVRQIVGDHQAKIQRTQERDPLYDWGCHLSAIPHKTGVYVLLYAEQNAYHDLWQALPEVEDYAYWNHTDPPDGMSQARWERRRQRWDALMPDGVSSHAGMTIDIYDPLIDWENRLWEVKPEYMPDYESRVRHWAFDRVVQEIWETEDPANRGFRTVFRAHDGIKTPAGAERWKAIQQTIRDIIPAVWDNALLHQTLPEIWQALKQKGGKTNG